MPRNNAWIETFTGRKFHLLDPSPSEVHIEDVAHALSLLCRYTGHTRNFYCVGDHSLRVSHLCDPTDALAGLLHDASEAYLADMNSPLKHSPEMSKYRTAEKRVQAVIMKRFGLPSKEPASVKLADRRLLVTEKRDLLSANGPVWENFRGFDPFPMTIVPMEPKYAEARFLDRFEELTGTRV